MIFERKPQNQNFRFLDFERRQDFRIGNHRNSVFRFSCGIQECQIWNRYVSNSQNPTSKSEST